MDALAIIDKYYVEDNPEIGDYEYDMLQRELAAIEKEKQSHE